MVEVIRDELKEEDPGRASAYDRRAGEYLKELKDLHEYGRKALAGKKERSLVTNHDSLHYFTRSFGLTVAGVVQVRAGTDVDPAALARLLETCKEKGVRVVATEPQFQKSAAETLVNELRRKGVADAALIELDPLETVSGGDTLDREWYVRKMRANIDALAKVLR